MEVQLDRLFAYFEGRRRVNSNILPYGYRHEARRMCDRDHEHRPVREDDRDRISRGGPGRSICDRPRRHIGGFRLTVARPRLAEERLPNGDDATGDSENLSFTKTLA